MNRHALSDTQWEKIEYLWPKGPGRPPKRSTRSFVDAVIWLLKTGVAWRDLPSEFGNWKTVYSRFRRWALADLWHAIFYPLAFSEDEIGSLLDATVIRAHQDASGGRGGPKKTPWDVVVVDSRVRYMRL